MKICTIGDTHGKDVLEKIKSELNTYDKIIFIGDYVDSFDISNVEIITNINNIITLKKEHPDKIILLWGNHDIQYLLGYLKHGCTGYRPEIQPHLHKIFSENKDLFLVAYQYENYIWTHAGIHQGWFKYRFKGNPNLNIAEQLNKDWENNTTLFDVGYIRGGHYDIGGVFWCDKKELISSPLRNYNQIVGHTSVKNIQKVYIKNCELNFIDVLNHEIKFHYKEFNNGFKINSTGVRR